LATAAIPQVIGVIVLAEIPALLIAWIVAKFFWYGTWSYFFVITLFFLVRMIGFRRAKIWLSSQQCVRVDSWRFFANLLCVIAIQFLSVIISVHFIFGHFEWAGKGVSNFGFNYFWGGLAWVFGVWFTQRPLSTLGQRAFWLCYFSFLASWFFLFGVFYFSGDSWRWWYWYFCGAISLVGMGFFGYRFVKKYLLDGCVECSDVSWRFWRDSVVSIAIQLTMAALFIYLIFDIFDLERPGWYGFSVGDVAFYYFVFGFFFIFLVFCLQFSLAKSAAGGAEMLRKVGGLVLAVLAGIALIAPVSNVMTERILSTTVSGNRSCVVFIWIEEQPNFAENIQNEKNRLNSKNLRIFAEVDGYYLVRNYHDAARSTLYFVPRNLVAGIKDCQVDTQATDKMAR